MSALEDFITQVLKPVGRGEVDETGQSDLKLPSEGVRLDLVKDLIGGLFPDLGDIDDLLPGMGAVSATLSACSVTASTIAFEAVEGGWDLVAIIGVDTSTGSFSATFQGGDSNPLTLGKALAHAGLDVPALGHAELDRIEARIDLAGQLFTLELGAANLLSFEHFSIGNAEVTFVYVAGGDDTSFGGSVVADLVIGKADSDPITAQISALYDGPDTGWTFSAELSNLKLSDLLERFGVTENRFEDFTVETASLNYNTAQKDLDFSFDGTLNLASTTPRLHLDVKLAHREEGGWDKSISGKLTVGSSEFDLLADQQSETLSFTAEYQHTAEGEVKLSDLVGSVLTLPQALDAGFNVKEALFAFQNNQGGKNFLFLVDTDIRVDLSGLGSLPLVGSAFSAGDPLVLSLVAEAAKQDETHPFDLQALPLPAGAPSLGEKVENRLHATLKFGELRLEVDIDAEQVKAAASGGAGDGGASGAASGAAAGAGGDNAPAAPAAPALKWLKIDKSFGPLSIAQVGVGFETGVITVGIDAAISVAGLTLSVDGLGASYKIADRSATFTLHGLGIDFQRGPLEIGGGFLNLDGDFAGKVTIKTEKFSIAALGAFTFTGGQPSMMIYGLLNYPLGGPSFFFVEGLAAGFGYNRSFKLPSIDAVREFPLVADAVGASDGKNAPASDSKTVITEQLVRLHDYISPSLGEYFIAVGIKFSSFKLINSFVLVAAAFGKRFELDLLGVSTYQTPPPGVQQLPSLAYIELNLLGRFSPDEGIVSIEGRLTDRSYIYSNLCHISGGFAFYTWFRFEHAGDFVLTVGGYHPRFSKPAWYPDVPRMELRYQITDTIYVKGSAYFALTPSTFMAGGALEARFQSGSLEAWFLLTIDFLICWQPYHYDASLAVTIGARWKCFKTEAHASVEIWGPDFSGIAHVDWLIFSFNISFGASTQRGPTPIDWNAFKTAFLPADDKVVTARIVRGASGGSDAIPVINPALLAIEVESQVPVREIVHDFTENGQAQRKTIDGTAGFGVSPMACGGVATSELNIKVERLDDSGNGPRADVTRHFGFETGANGPTGRITKAVPKALWDGSLARGLAADATFDAVVGYRMAAPPPNDGPVESVKREKASFEIIHERDVPEDDRTVLLYVRAPRPESEALERAAVQKALLGEARKTRAALLGGLGFEPIDLGEVSDTLVAALDAAPALVTAG